MLALRPSAGVADHFHLQVIIVTVVGQVVESHMMHVVLCTFSFVLILPIKPRTQFENSVLTNLEEIVELLQGAIVHRLVSVGNIRGV